LYIHSAWTSSCRHTLDACNLGRLDHRDLPTIGAPCHGRIDLNDLVPNMARRGKARVSKVGICWNRNRGWNPETWICTGQRHCLRRTRSGGQGELQSGLLGRDKKVVGHGNGSDLCNCGRRSCEDCESSKSDWKCPKPVKLKYVSNHVCTCALDKGSHVLEMI